MMKTLFLILTKGTKLFNVKVVFKKKKTPPQIFQGIDQISLQERALLLSSNNGNAVSVFSNNILFYHVEFAVRLTDPVGGDSLDQPLPEEDKINA